MLKLNTSKISNKLFEMVSIVKSNFAVLSLRAKILTSVLTVALITIGIVVTSPGKSTKYYNSQKQNHYSYNYDSDNSESMIEEENEWDNYSCDDALSK